MVFVYVPLQNIGWRRARLVKAIWAVACAVPLFSALFAVGNGCSGTRSQMKEFQRMDMGEGPGDVLTHLINLQKETGDTQAAANPPSAPQRETSIRPSVPSTHSPDASTGGLSTSKGSGAMRDVMPAVPPTSNQSLPVQTEVETARPSGGSASASSSTIESVQKVPSPVVTPVQPLPSGEKVQGPVPPVAHRMSLKKEATLETSSRGQASSLPTPPTSATDKARRKAAALTGGSKYRIGPEDVLHVDVWGNAELSGDFTVRPDGKISMALIQDVQAEGFTAGELSDVIQRKLMAFIKSPEVAVIVTQINAPKVFVIGNVTKPGSYPLRGDMSVLQALSLAGGFTPFASPKKIKVVSVGNGEQETHRFNYYDMIGKEGEEEGKYFLKPGDTIVVP